MKRMKGGGAWTASVTLIAPISWGTTYVTITELLPDGRPLFAAASRVLPAGLVLLVLGGVRSRWRPRGAQWWHMAVLGLANFGVFFPLLAVAAYRMPGGVAAAVGGVQPLLVAVLGWGAGGRRPRVPDLAVGVVAALGVALVVLRPGAALDHVGLLAALGANVSFAVGVVLTRRIPAPADRLAATGWQLLIGGAVLVPLALLAEGAPTALTGGNIAGIAHLSLVGTALAFVLWFDGIRALPATAPPLLGLAAPVTGVALGWALLGQSLSPTQLAGFAVTLGAIAHGALQRERRPAVRPVAAAPSALPTPPPVLPQRRREVLADQPLRPGGVVVQQRPVDPLRADAVAQEPFTRPRGLTRRAGGLRADTAAPAYLRHRAAGQRGQAGQRRPSPCASSLASPPTRWWTRPRLARAAMTATSSGRGPSGTATLIAS